MLSQVSIKLFPQTPNLGAVLVCLILGQIHPLLRKTRDVAVSYMLSRHRPQPFSCHGDLAMPYMSIMNDLNGLVKSIMSS
jgi:hypothetical protein